MIRSLVLLALAALAGRCAQAQTIPVYSQTLSVPTPLSLAPSFTVPAGQTGTLWLGTAGPADVQGIVVILNTAATFYESFPLNQCNAVPCVKGYPGLAPGTYLMLFDFTTTDGSQGQVLFEANLTLP